MVLISQSWVEDAERRWGKDDPRYISKVLAQFPDVSASSLFSPDLITKAMFELGDSKIPSQPSHVPLQLGVDVARFGMDDNVLVSFSGGLARVEDIWGGTDTVSSAQRVLDKAQELMVDLKAPHVDIRVDAVGLGAGVVDTLAARVATLEALGQPVWFTVKEMHGSASAPKNIGGSTGGYGNARAYWFDQLKLNMRNGSVRVLPPASALHQTHIHDQLREELGMVFYKYNNGRLYIISKEEMRDRYGKSPDIADALVYATAPVYDGLNVGDTVSEDPQVLLNQLQLEEALMLKEIQIAPY
jgi:hypothetical protein